MASNSGHTRPSSCLFSVPSVSIVMLKRAFFVLLIHNLVLLRSVFHVVPLCSGCNAAWMQVTEPLSDSLTNSWAFWGRIVASNNCVLHTLQKAGGWGHHWGCSPGLHGPGPPITPRCHSTLNTPQHSHCSTAATKLPVLGPERQQWCSQSFRSLTKLSVPFPHMHWSPEWKRTQTEVQSVPLSSASQHWFNPTRFDSIWTQTVRNIITMLVSQCISIFYICMKTKLTLWDQRRQPHSRCVKVTEDKTQDHMKQMFLLFYTSCN